MAHPFEQKVSDFIRLHHLVSDSDKIGVALSGGADSVALLAVMKALGFDVVALHCNFHLRSRESDRDEEHARRVAADLGVEWESIDFNVAQLQKIKPGLSVEMACRELRYAWFERRAAALGLKAVAIGHNRSDRAETFILNLMRSAGLRGLASMRPGRDIFIRPMLDCSRDEIEEYLAWRGLSYVTDSSNLTDLYTRNKVRHHILPALEADFPGATAAISRSMTHLESTLDLYESLVADRAACYRSLDGTTIDLARLLNEERFPAQLLYEMLRSDDISREQIADIISDTTRSGLKFGPWLLSRGMLLDSRRIAAAPSGELEQWCTLRRIPASQFMPERNLMKAWFDPSILDAEEGLTVRAWIRGDRMTPFGMKGSRLLSDIFNDLHLSESQKRRQPVVICGKRIVWLPGVKHSAEFPVRPGSSEIIEMEWN